MIFAEFQKNSTGWNGKDHSGPVVPVPALGSDGVYICDGRKTLDNQIYDAKERARSLNKNLNQGIIGLIMHRGPKFTSAKAIGKFIPID
jgi:hypothetical protein